MRKPAAAHEVIPLVVPFNLDTKYMAPLLRYALTIVTKLRVKRSRSAITRGFHDQVLRLCDPEYYKYLTKERRSAKLAQI